MQNKAVIWTEPQLRFKLGVQETIIDPKVGLTLHGPLDYNTKRRSFKQIRMGLICKEFDTVVGFLSKLNNSYPYQKVGDKPYKGFEKIYKIPLRLPEADETVLISDAQIEKAQRSDDPLTGISQLYEAKIQEFHDKLRGRYDVLVIQIPQELGIYDRFQKSIPLRSIVKASAIRRNIITQILTRKALTYQYDCDNMWNLSVALYTKAGGVPWKLWEFTNTNSFIGIAYGIKKTPNGQTVLTGLAEIFDEFGEHVSMTSIASEAFGKDFVLETDGSYHLSREKMSILMERLINEYKRRVKSFPERVVLHKTTYFNQAEKEGVRDILDRFGTSYDLLHIIENPSGRLFTTERPAPTRGTFWKLNALTGLLYTTGYVPSLGGYPGIGTPKPLEFRVDEGQRKLEKLGKEILALTKMDWNNTNLMISQPVTTKYASNIVEILKAGLQPDEVVKDIRYYI